MIVDDILMVIDNGKKEKLFSGVQFIYNLFDGQKD